MAFLIALGFNPLRIRLQKVVDEMFFRGEGIHRQELQAFTSALTQAVALDQIDQATQVDLPVALIQIGKIDESSPNNAGSPELV